MLTYSHAVQVSGVISPGSTDCPSVDQCRNPSVQTAHRPSPGHNSEQLHTPAVTSPRWTLAGRCHIHTAPQVSHCH